MFAFARCHDVIYFEEVSLNRTSRAMSFRDRAIIITCNHSHIGL